MSTRQLGLLMATITALSWAVLAIGLKLALKNFDSGSIVAFRLTLAFFILFFGFAFVNPTPLKILRRPPLIGLLAGILIALNYFGFMKGIEMTSASHAQILIQIAPLGFALTSILIFREIPNWRQTLGLITAGLGFGFFYWDQILLSLDDLERFHYGSLWLIGAAASWIGFALIQKSLLKRYHPQQFNLLIYAVSAILLLPTCHFEVWHDVTWWSWVLVVLLALNTVIAYGALSEAILRIPASHVSVIIAVNPLLTLIIMNYLTRMNVTWIKGEPIGWRGGIGALLVVIGVILTVFRSGKKVALAPPAEALLKS